MEVLEALWKLDRDYGISNSNCRYFVRNQTNGKIQFANNKPQAET